MKPTRVASRTFTSQVSRQEDQTPSKDAPHVHRGLSAAPVRRSPCSRAAGPTDAPQTGVAPAPEEQGLPMLAATADVALRVARTSMPGLGRDTRISERTGQRHSMAGSCSVWSPGLRRTSPQLVFCPEPRPRGTDPPPARCPEGASPRIILLEAARSLGHHLRLVRLKRNLHDQRLASAEFALLSRLPRAVVATAAGHSVVVQRSQPGPSYVVDAALSLRGRRRSVVEQAAGSRLVDRRYSEVSRCRVR